MRILRAWRNDGALHFEAVAESDTEFVDAFTSQVAQPDAQPAPLTASPRFSMQGRHAPSEAGRPAARGAGVKCPACGKHLLGLNGLAPHRASCPGLSGGAPAKAGHRFTCPDCDFEGGAAGLAIHRGRVHGAGEKADPASIRSTEKAPRSPNMRAYICKRCGSGFPSPGMLGGHRKGCNAASRRPEEPAPSPKARVPRPLSSSPVALLDALVKGDRQAVVKTFGIRDGDLGRLEAVAANTTGHSGFTGFSSEWGLVDERSRSEIAASVMKAWQEATP